MYDYDRSRAAHSTGGPHSRERQKYVALLTKGYTTRDPRQKSRIDKLERVARELDVMEDGYSHLNADDRIYRQSPIERLFDEYAALLEDTFGVQPERPWYYGN